MQVYRNKILKHGFESSSKGLYELECDEETITGNTESFDLLVSSNNLQFNNDMENALTNVLDKLVDDGCFLGSVPGSETLSELRNAFYIVENERFGGYSQRLLKFPDATFFSNSLSRIGYKMSAVHSLNDEIHFNDVFDLMHELQDNGISKCLLDSDSKISKDLFIALYSVYKSLYYSKVDRNKIKASVQSLIFIGYRQKEGQLKRVKKTVDMNAFKSYVLQDPDMKDRVKFGTIEETDAAKDKKDE